MTIQYKSAVFDLTTTNLTTVLTVATSAVAIVKTVQAVIMMLSNVDADLFLKKSGGSDVEVGHAQLNKSTVKYVNKYLEFRSRRCYKDASGDSK